MTDLREWLRGRRPAPPGDLADRVGAALDEAHTLGGEAEAHRPGEGEALEHVRWLSKAGGRALERAVDRPGRVRETAFELLVADALVTYACEAALEADHPLDALDEIVEVGRTR